MQGDKLLEKLTTNVEKLQSSCNYELEQQGKADNLEYANMASLYFWWLEASTIDGFLEAEYAKQSTRKLRAVSYGVNFRGILLKFYGNFLGNTVIDRKSRVLNELDKEVKKNPDLYATDGVKSLAQFIDNSKGMSGLYERTYGNAKREIEPYEYDDDDEVETDVADSDSLKKQYMEVVRVSISNDMRVRALIADAKEYFTHSSKLQKVKITPELSAQADDFVVIAAKKVNGSYEIIELTKNNKQLDAALVAAYRQQYAALPNSTRCVLETIKTQCLTQKAARHMDKALLEPPSYHDDDTVYRKLPAKRRLIYSYERNELILSPIDYEDENGNIVGGAVTIAKPKNKIFQSAPSDLYMPMMDRRVVEQRLIAPSDFNLFKASSDDTMKRHSKFDGDLSHLIRLDSKLNNGDFIFLNFFGFGNKEKILPQLDYDIANDGDATKIKLPIEQMRKVAAGLAKSWMGDIGENINRQQHRFWDLHITEQGFAIEYDEIYGCYEREADVEFDTPLDVAFRFVGTFFTHELVPALLTISELDVTGDVLLCLSDAGIVFEYETDAADYKICVPKWNFAAESRHNTNFFSLYTPETSAVDTEQFEFDDYELEADFYDGLAVLNMEDKATAQEHYKNKILSEQTELADGFPELSKNISWLTYDSDA
jgi:hypothetical protein